MPPGPPKGVRYAGRQKGTPNKAKVQAKLAIQAAAERARAKLTEDEIKAMKPLDVMLYAMHIHLEANDFQAASSIAKDCAPYMHARMAPIMPDKTDDDGRIIVLVQNDPDAAPDASGS